MDNSVNKFDISVIVPIYNVEEYLEECLDSIINQTKDNIEVIMINNGSTDMSGKIAEEYAEKHSNFRYFINKNNDLSSARNLGVTKATGKYIAFVDSDDVLASDMYEKMYIYAERNKSDLTICNVARFNSSTTWASSLHKMALRGCKLNTHITENHNLIYDTTSWNKLILRSFYLENGFSFPEGLLYEDIPVAIPMHVKANNVSVVESTYYYWRVRDGASKSITQNTDNLKNLEDRLTILCMLNEFLEDYNDKALIRAAQKKALIIDLMIFVNNVRALPIDDAKAVLNHINAYLDKYVDEDVIDETSLMCREKYRCVREYNIENLISLINYAGMGYYNAPVNNINDELIVSVPNDIFTLENRNITNEIAATEPESYVFDIKADKGVIEIFAHIFIPRLDIPSFEDQKVVVYLENEYSGELTELDAEPYENDILTKNTGVVFDQTAGVDNSYNYDGTGFKITIDLSKIDVDDAVIGYNKILVCYENRLVKSMLRLSATRLIANENATLLNGVVAGIHYDRLKELRIKIVDSNAFAENLSVENGCIVVKLQNKAERLYALDSAGNEIDFNTEDYLQFACPADSFELNEMLYVFVKNFDEQPKNLLFTSKRVLIGNNNDLYVIVMTNKNYLVRFKVARNLTTVRGISDKENVVTVKTSCNGVDDEHTVAFAYLFMNDNISSERTVLSRYELKETDKKLTCTFNIDFNNEEITKNLYASIRDIYIAYFDKNGNELVTDLIYSSKFYKSVIDFETYEYSCYRGIAGNIRLQGKRLWREEENTLQKRRALTAKMYPEYRKKPINQKRIMFESMWGRKYSCNPQHLYEYIDEHYPEYECVWSLLDERTPIKGNGIRVRRGSQEYYEYLATSKFFVNNVNFEDAYVKREGQIEIQTMHGTPLKTLGLDVPGDFVTEESKNNYISKNDRWNYLIVQGEFMRDKAYDCFRFDREFLDCGYPRTDVLFNADDKKKAELKEKMNLPKDKKVIFYTPTWRKKGAFDMHLNIEKMRKELSDEYILLVRLHHLCSPAVHIEADNEFVFDFYSYRCIEDLYIISDIVITDYSSVMFDYAILNRPMLFFTYDLDDYRDNLRGMYVDIEKEAPGPLLFNTKEVINAIKNIDFEMEKCADRISAFKKKFLNYEAGDSCKQIVTKVLKPDPIAHNTAVIKRGFKKLFK